MIFRLILGSILALLFFLIFTGKVNWFIGFNEAQKIIFNPNSISLAKAKTGFIVIYLMPLFSLYFIVFSQETIKVIGGIFLSLITFMVLFAFN